MRFLVLVLFAAVMGCGGDDDLTPVEARVALKELGIDYTESKFLDAAKRGDLVVVKLFLQAGMSVDTANERGGTALYSAAANGHLDVVEFLVGAGSSVTTATTNEGFTALHLAASHLSVVRFLVEQGAAVDGADNGGITALHRAAGGGHLDVVEFLVGSGADLEVADDDGWTALHVAAGLGHLETVRYLVGSGADLEATSNRGRTPRDEAARCSTSTSSFSTDATRADCAAVVEYLESL